MSGFGVDSERGEAQPQEILGASLHDRPDGGGLIENLAEGAPVCFQALKSYFVFDGSREVNEVSS